MKTVELNPLAEKELTDAVVYYEEQKAGLGLEFLEAVEQAVNLLMRYRAIGLKVGGYIRRLGLQKFPYSLLYRLLSDEGIRILAV